MIRIRRRGSGGAGPTRLDVEDLLDGGRATVSGDPAASLADRLERLVSTDDTGPIDRADGTDPARTPEP